MKTPFRLALVTVALLTTVGFSTSTLLDRQAEKAAVEATINLYFEGILEYDADKLRQAFHADAHIMAAFPNGTFDRAFEEWVGFTNGQAPADVSEYKNEIISIDIAGGAATVKTDLEWPTVHYIDYLNLLKIDGEWKIVNKIFHQERR